MPMAVDAVVAVLLQPNRPNAHLGRRNIINSASVQQHKRYSTTQLFESGAGGAVADDGNHGDGELTIMPAEL